MKFLVIVLVVRFIITLVDKKERTKETTIERNDVKDPAAFQLR